MEAEAHMNGSPPTTRLLHEMRDQEQVVANFAHLARQVLLDREINEQAMAAQQVLAESEMTWKAIRDALAATDWPFTLRQLDRCFASRNLIVAQLPAFLEHLLHTLSRTEVRGVSVVSCDDETDRLDTALGIFGVSVLGDAWPSDFDTEVVLRRDLTRMVRNDVAVALPLITENEPTEIAIQLLTALVLELTGHMPRDTSPDADESRLSRVQRALHRARV